MATTTSAPASLAALSALLMTPLLGCSGGDGVDQVDMAAGEDGTGAMVRCARNERLNLETNRCEPDFSLKDMGVDATNDLGRDQGGGDLDAEVLPDEGPDLPCVETLLYRDEDGDGSGVDDAATNQMICLALDATPPDGYARGAGDCDDADRSASPALAEQCDGVDNDCDGVINQGMACEFFVHSRDTLYSIDPFKLTLREEGEIDTPASLLDIDTHPDGQLYGISFRSLFVYGYNNALDVWEWRQVGDLQKDLENANGLAIDRDGKAYATKANVLYEIDLRTGVASAPSSLSGEVNSSGDCVVNKGDTLLMTSKATTFGSTRPDELVRIDRVNNTTQVIGLTNHQNIFGLTSAWGTLYGVTGAGELIEINQQTGQSVLLKQFNVETFYGAASTPNR